MDKGAAISDDNIYMSEHVSDAKKHMAKILSENSSWRESISKLNECIIDIFKQSKYLRIEQNSNVSGDVHLKN